MDGNMKKQLLIISIIVVIVSIFVSCSVNKEGNIQLPSTTAVTDEQGTTHYYEPVTDDEGNISTTAKNKGVFAEIETQSNGKAVTKKNGEYVTNEHTTALSIENVTDRTSSTTKPATKQSSTSNTTTDIDDADNDIEFETPSGDTTKPTTEKTTTTTTETTTQKEIQPATDKDGWITKWY